jgi:hypothetical protein
MTMSESAETELPLDRVQPRRPVTWRTIGRWSIGVALVAALVGPLTWWQLSARADVLGPGYSSYYGTAAILQAGNATEYCYPDKPGSTIVFGFSILNAGGHDVTVRSIDEISGMADQKITVDPQTTGGSDGPGASTQTLPLTIHPGQDRQLYVAMHLSTDIVDAGGGESYFDSVMLRVRSLGIDRTQNLPLGDRQNPLWIGISGIDDQGKSCDRDQPPITD